MTALGVVRLKKQALNILGCSDHLFLKELKSTAVTRSNSAKSNLSADDAY